MINTVNRNILIFCIRCCRHGLRIGVVGGQVVHKVGDIIAGIAVETNRINRCAVGVLCFVSLAQCAVGFRCVIAVFPRLTVCEHNNDTLGVFTELFVIGKDLVCHLHTVAGTGRTAASNIGNRSGDGRSNRTVRIDRNQCCLIVAGSQLRCRAGTAASVIL